MADVEAISRLVNQLSKLPGIGRKTAQRLAYHIISQPEDQVRSMGRSAAGVRGISLRDGDEVAGACILERDEAWAAENKLITITEGGFGKRMEPAEFEAKGRGIMGVIAQKVTEKTGRLCGIAVVKADEDIMMITNDGTIIRTPAAGIPLYGRPAAGVIVMKLSDGAKLVNFALTEKEKDEEAAEASGETAESAEAEAVPDAEPAEPAAEAADNTVDGFVTDIIDE